MNKNTEIDYKRFSPLKQGGVVVGLILVFDIVTYAAGVGEDSIFNPTTYWINTLAFLLVYSIFNTVLSLAAEDQNKYIGQSIMVFMGICVFGGVLSYLFSGLSIDEAGSFRWLFTVFAMGYILFLGIVRSMKWIVLLAQKEDKRLRGEE